MSSKGQGTGFRWQWWMWIVLFLVLMIPVPGNNGLWLPVLFQFFEWLNNFLPENF